MGLNQFLYTYYIMEIIDLAFSPRETKRFKIVIRDDEGNDETYHFGLDTGSTYIDHQDKRKRSAYRKRHYGNKREKQLIDGNIPSPALFSYRLLWGDSPDLIRRWFRTTPHYLPC